MARKATRSDRLLILIAEIDAIHFTNRLFWEQPRHSRQATAEYELRQHRLEEIRREFYALQTALRETSLPAPGSFSPLWGDRWQRRNTADIAEGCFDPKI
jgi:hypothetical protein